MGKIIFLDVDGTLVDYENKIPVSAVKAIRMAKENCCNSNENSLY